MVIAAGFSRCDGREFPTGLVTSIWRRCVGEGCANWRLVSAEGRPVHVLGVGLATPADVVEQWPDGAVREYPFVSDVVSNFSLRRGRG